MKIEIEPTRGTEVSDFTNGATECFCDKQYKDANKLESCGDCPRDYIVGAWCTRRKYVEDHLQTTCDPGTIRTLLGERDVLTEEVEHDKALLRQALEALEQIATDLPWELTALQADTITALRKRLGDVS